MSALAFRRTADPYRDTDVIDRRAPRVNQAVIGILSAIAVVTGLWPLVAVLAAQLAVGLTFGRRFCLACVLYFEVIQPRLGEGPLEDSRPPRFANLVGLVFLGASTAAYVAGLAAIGAALAAIVAVLALLAATTGLCVGCEMYRLAARLRGVRPSGIARVEASDVGSLEDGTVVSFTHPLCSDCHELERALSRDGHRVVLVDVSRRPELARKYGIAVVPTAVSVAADGTVVRRIR